MSQTMTTSETLKPDLNVNEILDDLLYRSSKPNPNREILVASSVSHKNPNANKSQCRQRQPALLLPAITDNSSHSSVPNSRHATNGNCVPVVVSRQNSANYWTQRQYPSESEFDTTRIDNYLNALNLSRRHRSQRSSSKQNVKPLRSRSVDTTLSRLRLSIHKPVNSLLNAITSPSGAKIAPPVSCQSAGSSSKSQTNRNACVTRSESLNSEGSSLSGESLCCEFNSSLINPGKSVLKKTNNTSTVHMGPGKKNVTFSAFATIQLMEG